MVEYSEVVPKKLFDTLRNVYMVVGEVGDEWVRYAVGRIERYAEDTDMLFLGYHPGSSRSLVALLGDVGGGDTPTLVAKVAPDHSPTVTPDTIGYALETWGYKGFSPETEYWGDGFIVSLYVPSYPEDYALDPGDVVDVLTRNLSFEGGHPMTLRERLDVRMVDAVRRHDYLMSVPRDVLMSVFGDDVVRRVSKLVHQVEDNEAGLLKRCGDYDEPCHGDMASSNVLKSHGMAYLIDPEPHLGPREIDLSRLIQSSDITFSDSTISSIVKESGLDYETFQMARLHSEATMQLYRYQRELTL